MAMDGGGFAEKKTGDVMEREKAEASNSGHNENGKKRKKKSGFFLQIAVLRKWEPQGESEVTHFCFFKRTLGSVSAWALHQVSSLCRHNSQLSSNTLPIPLSFLYKKKKKIYF